MSETTTPVPARPYKAPPMYTEEEYYLRPWNVFCHFCHDTATDTEANLRRYGWTLKQGLEMCPVCTEKIQRTKGRHLNQLAVSQKSKK